MGLLVLMAGWYRFGSESSASGGRYVEGIVGLPSRPTPLFARANPVDADLAALLFSGLTRITGDGTPTPDLAERWDVTPDGLAYTFILRPDLVWHDGRPLTAQDVAFTVSAVQSPGFQGSSSLAARWTGITVLTPDERTVVFRLPAPSAAFLALAALGIVPRHLLNGLGPAELIEAPATRTTIGNGPFRLMRMDLTGARLEPNPIYHLGTPGLEAIELRFYPDDASLIRALARREIDGALLSARPSSEALGAVVARPQLHATPLVEASYTVLYVNNQREPLFEPALRRALAASIDRTALIAEDDSALPGDGPIVPGSWAYAPGGWATRAQAEALFIAAGWRRVASGPLQRDGKILRLELLTNDDPQRVTLAEAIAAQLRGFGVEATVRALSPSELLGRHINNREYDLLLFGWQADVDPDPYGGWHTSQIASGGRNVAGFHDLEADRLLEQARLTLDTAERKDLYMRWQARYADLAPSVVLHYSRRLYVQPRNLTGGSASVLFEPASRFTGVHEWHIAREKR